MNAPRNVRVRRVAPVAPQAPKNRRRVAPTSPARKIWDTARPWLVAVGFAALCIAADSI